EEHRVMRPNARTRGNEEPAVPSLSVVIPAYNEEARLAPTVTRAIEFLDTRGSDWEILVVDDGSRDRTSEVAHDAARGHPRVRVLAQPRNGGKGKAVRVGMLEARGDRLLFSDADLATPIEELASLEARLDAGADIAIASRALPESDIRVRQHPLREVMG